MSFQAMTWAVEQDLPCTQKMVLLMLANRVNGDTGCCIPRIKLLASDCGLSETATKNALKSLVERGVISVEQRFQEGIQLSNSYKLNMLVSEVGRNTLGVGRQTTPGGSGGDPGVGRQTPTEPGSFEPGKEPKEILDYLNQKTGSNFKPVETNLNLVKARLKEGFTVAEIKAVIDAKKEEWGNDEKMAQYLRPETLFGARKFAQYAGAINTTGSWWVKAGFQHEYEAINTGCTEKTAYLWANGKRKGESN